MGAYNGVMSDEEFEQWRYVQDDYADSVAAILVESPYSKDIYPILGQIAHSSDEVTVALFKKGNPEFRVTDEHEHLIQVMSDYFNDLSLIPKTESELSTIRRGCELFDLHVGDCLFALTLRSLLKQYAAYKATNVLVATKLLVEYPHRRMVETLQFVADVMDVDGFEPDGHALRSIQKLRLVHAMIRYRINKKKNNPDYQDSAITMTWNDEWGLPINQQDMIFAIHTFSTEVIDGLLARGLKLSPEAIEDYYMTWHYFGRALGVHPELNPTNYNDGKVLQDRIYKSQFVPNPNASALTPPLIEFTKSFLPFSPSDTHIYAMIKAYNDEKDYEPVFENILGIPINKAHLGWTVWFFILNAVLESFSSLRVAFIPKDEQEEHNHSVSRQNDRIIQALVDMNKTWSSKNFRIADGFGDSASKLDASKLKSQPSFFDRFRVSVRV